MFEDANMRVERSFELSNFMPFSVRGMTFRIQLRHSVGVLFFARGAQGMCVSLGKAL